MSNLPPDPSFPDSRRLRLEAEATAALAKVETVVEEIVHPAAKKPTVRARVAAKRSHKKKPAA